MLSPIIVWSTICAVICDAGAYTSMHICFTLLLFVCFHMRSQRRRYLVYTDTERVVQKWRWQQSRVGYKAFKACAAFVASKANNTFELNGVFELIWAEAHIRGVGLFVVRPV